MIRNDYRHLPTDPVAAHLNRRRLVAIRRLLTRLTHAGMGIACIVLFVLLAQPYAAFWGLL